MFTDFRDLQQTSTQRYLAPPPLKLFQDTPYLEANMDEQLAILHSTEKQQQSWSEDLSNELEVVASIDTQCSHTAISQPVCILMNLIEIKTQRNGISIPV